MKKIAFIAHGPASGNVLKPLIERCQNEQGFVIDLYAFHPYVATLWACKEQNKDTYSSLFQHTYDYIFYGTGSGHEMERMVPHYAKPYGSISISILDAFWCSVDNLRFRYEYVPDVLIVPEESSRKKVVDSHIMASKDVLAFGNPHFDRLKGYRASFREPTPPYDIVVFSQPSATSDFSDTAEEVKACLQALSEIHKTTALIHSVTVTPHPREDTVWLTNFCRNNQYILETRRASFDLLLEKDISVGIDCTLQYEALMIGKPTIFYKNKETLLTTLQGPSSWGKEKLVMNFNATDTIFHWLKTL